jgi:hypothetical protein
LPRADLPRRPLPDTAYKRLTWDLVLSRQDKSRSLLCSFDDDPLTMQDIDRRLQERTINLFLRKSEHFDDGFLVLEKRVIDLPGVENGNIFDTLTSLIMAALH